MAPVARIGLGITASPAAKGVDDGNEEALTSVVMGTRAHVARNASLARGP